MASVIRPREVADGKWNGRLRTSITGPAILMTMEETTESDSEDDSDYEPPPESPDPKQKKSRRSPATRGTNKPGTRLTMDH